MHPRLQVVVQIDPKWLILLMFFDKIKWKWGVTNPAPNQPKMDGDAYTRYWRNRQERVSLFYVFICTRGTKVGGMWTFFHVRNVLLCAVPRTLDLIIIPLIFTILGLYDAPPLFLEKRCQLQYLTLACNYSSIELLLERNFLKMFVLADGMAQHAAP